MSKFSVNLIVLVVLAVLVYLSAFIVNERELAIQFKLGEIVKSDFEPGLYWMIPIVNNVRKFDSRLQSMEAPPERYLTSEKKNVMVDAFVKWRIIDVAEYYRSTQGDIRLANNRLSRIVNNALKNQISQRPILDLVSGERVEMMDKVRVAVETEAASFGIGNIDVRIKKLDYSQEISGSVFERMVKERETVAKKLRSEGMEEAKIIRAEAQREREEILAEAYREAQQIRGEGDAKSAEIYAQAFSENPEFYDFYRSLQAYRKTFNSSGDILLLQPESQFFNYFKQADGR